MPKCFVRITSTPDGEAPLEIREKWVGLVLPVWNSSEGAVQTDVLSGRLVKPINGYVVNAEDALKVLGKRNPQAKAWWEEHYARPHGNLIFDESCCEVLPD